MEQTDLSKEEIKEIILHQRIKKIKNKCDFIFKKCFISTMPCYTKFLNINEIENELLPCISDNVLELSDDNLSLFLQSLYQITKYLNEKGTKGNEIIKDKIIPVIFKIFTPQYLNNITIKKNILELMILIAQNLQKEDLGILLLSKLIEISNQSDNFDESLRVENLIIIIRLISNLITDFGDVYSEKFILPQLQMLSGDKNILVKKEVCRLLPKISHEISVKIHINKLRPLFTLLCQDENCEIRIESVYILPDLMKDNQEKTNFEESNQFYINQYSYFMYDNNRDVRIATLNSFGKFIMLLGIDELDKKYLDFFKNAIDEYYFYTNDFNLLNAIKSNKRSIIYSSAYNFPAVLYRFGKISWDILKYPYKQMINDKDSDVTLSIISSFHEICALLGDDIIQNELIEIYDSFLKHKDEKIKNFAQENLTNVLNKLTNVDLKKQYLDYLKKFTIIDMDNINKYSPEKENVMVFNSYIDKLKASSDIERYFCLFDDDVIYDKFLRLEILLCLDEMEFVRRKCAKTLARILLHLFKRNIKKDNIIQIIRGFALNTKFKRRNQFLLICKSLLSSSVMFSEYLFDLLLNCFFDKVIDVRIQLAKLIGGVINQEELELNYLLKNQQFLILFYLINNSFQYKDILNFLEIKNISCSDEIKKESELILSHYKYINPNDEDFNQFIKYLKIQI